MCRWIKGVKLYTKGLVFFCRLNDRADSTLFIIYNVVYLSCVINTITTYGNMLSILLFVFESTNVSIDWFCVNLIRN